MIRDLESDSSLLLVPPMDGAAGCCVGYTFDMSVNLGNSSHYDVNNASQGYSVWTERGDPWPWCQLVLCHAKSAWNET